MEFKTYFGIVKKRWKIVAFAFLATVLFTAYLASGQEPVYESSGTYVVRPRPLAEGDAVRAIDTLVRGVEINSTFASIASSDLVKAAARDRVDPAIDTSGLKTSGKVVTGTNIIELTVSGQDPDAVYALAVAVGDETISYIGQLDETFELEPLDAPRLPKNPVGPNTPLTMATGVFLGLLLGVSLAVGLEVLTTSAPEARREEETEDDGIEFLDEEQFDRVFHEQLAETRRHGTSFTVGLLTAIRNNAPARAGGRSAADVREFDELVRSSMPLYRKGARIISLGKGKFAIIESDLPAEEAEELLMVWLTVWKAAIEVADLSTGDPDGVETSVSIGVSSYGAGSHPDRATLRAVGS
jgi:capsular polysaccharide biosynthesis protein